MEFHNQSFNLSSFVNNSTGTEEVPVIATYLSMVIILMATIIVIAPTIMIINVIWQTRELHNKYFFFVANLLGTIAIGVIFRSVLQYLVMILYLLKLNSHYVGVIVKWVYLTLSLLFYLVDILLPISLAAERMIVIAFPYRHRSIMTTKMVAGILAAVWGLSAILTITSTIVVPVDLLWALAVNRWDMSIFPYLVIPRLISVISITVVNILLQYKITITARKAEENKRLGNEEEKRFDKLVKTFRTQFKTTITLFLVGGIDVIADILLPIMYVAIGFMIDPSKHIYIGRFLVYPIEIGVMLSQILIYGLYMRKIRKRLPNWITCHGLWIIRHNRVGVLHQRP